MAQAKQRPPSGKRQPNQPPQPKSEPTESAQKVGVTERRAQRFSTLSTGERQKVQMARVLMNTDEFITRE